MLTLKIKLKCIFITLFPFFDRSPKKTEAHTGCNNLMLQALQQRAKILNNDTNDDDW